MDLAASYAPQNWYCYTIDAKSNPLFKARMYSLAECFPNVFVNQKELSMDSAGHNMSLAQVQCMEALAKPDRKWEYLVLLQNHDITARTNQELVQIFKWLQGANDVEFADFVWGRVNFDLDWTFKGLNLFKNGTRNLVDHNGYPSKLQFAKGYVQASVSRAAVDYMINELNLTTMIAQLDDPSYFGMDEFFLQTLMATEAIDVPGGFTHACDDKGIPFAYVTRYSRWIGQNCKSGHIRHFNCIFGIEDLAPLFMKSKDLYINKLLPEFDFGAIRCWYEELQNRANNDRGLHRLNATFYQQLPQVRYQLEKQKYGFVNNAAFDCRLGAADSL